MTAIAIGREAIAATYQRIKPHVRRTPVIEVASEDFGLAGRPVVLKLEQLQRSGSFKARGAFANLLLRDVPAAGVAAASGGNHGVAVALAARALGHPARIFVPRIASPAKIARIRAEGATLVVEGERYVEAAAACERWIAETGALGVHAYDAPETLLGQGSVGLEWETQAGLDTVLVAVGGGGLVGGIAAWYDGRATIVAVEPEGAPSLHMAMAAGEPVDAPMGSIAADSLAPLRVGKFAFALARSFVDRSVLVSDDAIRKAQSLLWHRLGVVAEPGGATALAALVSGAYRPAAGERVGVLVCGANTTVVDLPAPETLPG
jgi:threonine dehydratase